MGCGAIGLMALQMAKASGARHIYAIEHAHNAKKAALALEYGADEVIFSDREDLTAYNFPRGGVDRVLVTTPPSTIDLATRILNVDVYKRQGFIHEKTDRIVPRPRDDVRRRGAC